MKSLGAVVGTGARTPLGLNARESAFLYRAGHVGLCEAAVLDENEEPTTMCLVPTLDPYLSGPERVIALAEPALAEALTVLGPLAKELEINVVVSLDERGADDSALSPQVESALRTTARHYAHEDVGVGLSSGGPAGPGRWMEKLLGDLRAGKVDIVALGGVHTDYSVPRVHELEYQGRLFSSGNLDSLIPGECAAFVLLADPHVARRYGLPELARINAVGSATEHARPDNDLSAYEAAGLTVALRKAFAPLDEESLQVGWMLSDLTFEMRELYEWQSAAVRHQRYLCEPQYTDFPAHRLGHMGAAALPLSLALVADAWRYGFGPHERAVLLAGNDAGERVAVLASAGEGAVPPEPEPGEESPGGAA